jgi:O6-methylguanine-DNA--protein-cysteine methyltransferase
MKLKLKNLSNLASTFASASSRGYSLVQHQVSEASASALETGKSLRHTVSGAFDQIEADKAAARAQELVHSASTGARKLTSHFVDLAQKADANHKEVADKIETVSMGLGITAGVTAAGAAVAAPTGIGAVGVALGLTSAPLIVAAAPVIAAVATTAGVVSGSAYFYSKWRSRSSEDTEVDSTVQTAAHESPQRTE